MLLLLFAASFVILLILLIIQCDLIAITKWCRSQKCLIGKTAIVTGSNTGIGYETALDFAKRGARVILACRNRQKAEEARDRIINETGNGNIVVKIIDMSSFKSVRAFAKDINETENRLDILVNNAGIAEMENKKSEDGHQLIYQVNYFSAFLLTHLLLGLLKKTKQSRIVNISSIMAKFAFYFDVNKLENYPGHLMGYGYSKLCVILFTMELARKLAGTGVTTYSLHPGFINTAIFDYVKVPYNYIVKLITIFFKTSEEGAQTSIYCALTPEIEKYSGGYFQNCQKVPFYYTVDKTQAFSKKLWAISEQIVQLTPEEFFKKDF